MDLKVLTFVFLLYLFNTSLAATFTTELKSHFDNNFDITTIFKLQENNNDTLTTCSRPNKSFFDITKRRCFDTEIHVRTNAIGMPIHFNGRVLSLKENALEFIVDTYYKNNFTTNNHVEYDANYWSIQSEFYNNGGYRTATGSLLRNHAYYSSYSYLFNISWTPVTTIKGCISLTYTTSYLPNVHINIYEKENSSPMISYSIPKDFNGYLKTLILRTNELFLRKKTYHLVITVTNDGSFARFFWLKRLAQCNDEGEVYKISGYGIEDSSLSAHIYHLDGSKSVDSAFVYKECNQNEFGADCSGICSTRETFCQRMLFCTSRYGCSCGSGYYGQFCEQKCPEGIYGPDCQKKCGENCNSCDIYTGVCFGGCKKHFILPNCTEKYPWLINPPQLVSSDYYSVKLNVSFEKTNIAGSKQKTPLYFQIIYKASSSSEFGYLDVKKIGDSNYTIVNIDNLLLGTEYTFGAIVITNDGNFNDEDIITANYITQSLKCPEGTYGPDCQKKCEENCNSCDIYKGICIGGCKQNFILPNCTEKYPWLITPPQFVSSDYHSVKLNVSFEKTNIAGSKQKTPLYYQLLYKQASSSSEFGYLDVKQIGDSNYAIVNIDNLLLGTEYTFGAVAISDDGNFNDEDINTTNYKTQCLIPKNMDYGIKLVKGAKYINVTWEKYNKKDIHECEINNYMIKLIFNQKKNVHEVAYTSSNRYDFDNLVPAHTYAVQVTAITTFGPTDPSDLYYETTDLQGYISIRNITANLVDSDTILHLTWELNDANIDASISYMIKYKITRHYSCLQRTINSNWTKIIVDNKTEYNILDLIPNTQYVIKVEPITTGYTYSENENIIFVKTTTSTPSIAPVLDASQPVYVNNETALIKWRVDKEKCNKLNGIITGFHIILKNLMDGTQIVKESEETTVEYTNLNSNTEYELRVYIKNDKGLHVNYVLSVPFKTKSKFLPSVEELSVYKKNSKSREIGLRWSYSNNTDVDGFIIQVNPKNQKTNVKQMTIEPLKCKAWPSLYCTTLDNLTHSTQYTIKVLAKSVDYPSGGLPGSINVNTIDGSPDEPKNVKAIYVGIKNVMIEWDIPWMFNGVLSSFIINAEEITAVDVDSCCASFPVMELQVTEELPTYNYTINDLKPGSTYTIGVLSKTLWYGQANKIYVTTLLDTTADIPSGVSENNSTETN